MNSIEEENLFELKLGEEAEFYVVGDAYAYYAIWDSYGNKIYLDDDQSVEEVEMMTGIRASWRVMSNVYFPGEDRGRILDTYYKYIFPIMENIPRSERKGEEYYNKMMSSAKKMNSILRIRVERSSGRINKYISFVDGNLDLEFKKNLVRNMVDLKEFVRSMSEKTKSKLAEMQ